jgi:ubiquinol-cytochrome c reductase iron-sulfur subunit
MNYYFTYRIRDCILSANFMLKMTKKEPKDPQKRDFVVLSATAMAGLCAATAAVPLVSSMNPSKDVEALSSIEVDLSDMEIGQEKKVMWRGKPIFIKRRTKEEIEEARETPMADLIDPETDQARVKDKSGEYLVVVGVCTHLGCVPLGNNSGEFEGWLCPCHGSHYDTSGRIRKGPAPTNLVVPSYEFISDKVIKIG